MHILRWVIKCALSENLFGGLGVIAANPSESTEIPEAHEVIGLVTIRAQYLSECQ